MRRNKQPEAALQRAVVQYLELALPEDAYFLAIPNGGKRSKIEAAIMRGLGVKVGAFDLLILYQGRAYWIELKAAKGKLSLAQQGFFTAIERAGCQGGVAYSVNDVAYALHNIWAIPLRARPA